MTNTESKISIWYHTIDSMLTAQEKESLIMAIELLLAERTEQCAKIAEDRIDCINNKTRELELSQPIAFAAMQGRVLAVAGKEEAGIIAKQIRALNQETKS